jgi:hypothetical protein
MYTNSLRASLIYRLYSVGDRTEFYDTPASVHLGVDISPSTDPLNCLSKRNELINLIKLTDNSNVDNLYSKPGPPL